MLVLDKLKKKIAIFVICGCLSLSNIAQNFGGGTIIGISTSQVSGDDLGGYNKAGLIIGAFANRLIKKGLTFQMEMIYIQKGSHNPRMNDSEYRSYNVPDIYLSYIEIPILLQHHQTNNLKIEGGLNSAYLINGYYNDSYGKMRDYGSSIFLKYDLGLMFGINYKYSDNISLITRISNSIIPIGDEDYNHLEAYNYQAKGKYNSVLSFTINYNFS